MLPEMDSSEQNNEQDDTSSCDKSRNLSGFWLLGLCNNFAYVVMLSAAHDILDKDQWSNITSNHSTSEEANGHLVDGCNEIGTGAILLADILPTLVVKLTGSLFIYSVPYSVLIPLVVVFAAASFPVVSTSTTIWMSLLGVVFASTSGGLGEISFLGLTSYFDKNTVSTWSSGTGAAGLSGSLSYAGMTSAGLTPRVTLLVMLVVPVVMVASYFVLLKRPPIIRGLRKRSVQSEELDPLIHDQSQALKMTSLSIVDRLRLMKPLLQYMVPLSLVYIAEYVINQALFELLHFDIKWLKKNEQYRWYQVIYQTGVFASRSSVNLIKIKQIWILPALQFVNVGIFMLQIFTKFIPSIWIMFVLIFYEGLLGGGAYVNTFYKITIEVPEEDKEHSMAMVSVADACGIAVAGLISIPLHNYICTL